MSECPITKAWKILGKPWRLVIIDRLLSGSKSFNELLWSMKGISSRTLSKALRELCKEELVKVEEKKKRKIYSLTEKGRELTIVVKDIRDWSEKWLFKSQE
ncbi:MAG: helix-turn-helix domain-containing protein [Thermoproteota archaeon]|nr:helix-turn-helix domain-containing protein [Thermoproteota archaeon]